MIPRLVDPGIKVDTLQSEREGENYLMTLLYYTVVQVLPLVLVHKQKAGCTYTPASTTHRGV